MELIHPGPNFERLENRNMVDELMDQGRLAREAAFELLLARDPMQAAALDQRITESTQLTADHRHNTLQRPPPKAPIVVHKEVGRLRPPPMYAQKPRPPGPIVAARPGSPLSHRLLAPDGTEIYAPKPTRPRVSPGGIWASNNRHLPGGSPARSALTGNTFVTPEVSPPSTRPPGPDVLPRPAAPLGRNAAAASPTKPRHRPPGSPSDGSAGVPAVSSHPAAQPVPSISAARLPPSQRKAAAARSPDVGHVRERPTTSHGATASSGVEGSAPPGWTGGDVVQGGAPPPKTPPKLRSSTAGAKTPVAAKARDLSKSTPTSKGTPGSVSAGGGAGSKGANAAKQQQQKRQQKQQEAGDVELPMATTLPPPGALGEASAGGLTACVRAAKAFQNGAEGPPEGWKPEAETPLLGGWLHSAEPNYLGKGTTGGGGGAEVAPIAERFAAAQLQLTKDFDNESVGGDSSFALDYAFGTCDSALLPGGMLPPPLAIPGAEGGFGGRGSYGQPSQPKHVLLQVDVAGRPPQYVRHPGSLPALRTRLARLLRFGENSLRVSAEVSVSQEKLPPTQERPRVMAIRATGRPLAGAFDALFLCMAWLNLGTAIAFCAIELSQAPFPFHYLVVLPALPFYFNVSSVSTAIRGEYLINKNLRDVLGRKSIELWLLLVLSFAGCDTTLMLAATTLLPRGVKLSDECSNALRANAAVIAPLTLDLPLLLVNYLWHKRAGAPYDMLSLVMLALSAFSLIVHTPYRVSRLLAAHRRQAERREMDGDSVDMVGEGTAFGWKEPGPDELPSARGRGARFSPEKNRGEREVSPLRMQLRRSQNTATEAIMAQLLAKREELERVRQEAMEAGEVDVTAEKGYEA